MTLDDLEVLSGDDFHERVMWHHLAKFGDTPVYFLCEHDGAGDWCWLTICQDDDNDDGLWRGECDFCGYQFDDYVGREKPEDVLAALMLEIQTYVAKEILAA